MELSKIVTIDLKEIRISPVRSTILTKMLALEIGQGFEASDVEERSTLQNFAGKAKKEGRSISVKKRGAGKYLVYRWA